MKLRPRDASAALALLTLGCAGAGSAARTQDLDTLRTEVRSLRSDNERLARDVEALERRVELLSARRARPAEPSVAEAPATIVPPDLAVVRVSPPRAPRAAPPVPTAVPIAEPDPDRLESLARPTGRELAVDADEELEGARRRQGLERATRLEAFGERYPRHPSADNALVEAAVAYSGAGREEAACRLVRRAVNDYPAGDAMGDALERLAWCESRRGDAEAERRLLDRIVADYPRSPAAERAGARLAAMQRSGP